MDELENELGLMSSDIDTGGLASENYAYWNDTVDVDMVPMDDVYPVQLCNDDVMPIVVVEGLSSPSGCSSVIENDGLDFESIEVSRAIGRSADFENLTSEFQMRHDFVRMVDESELVSVQATSEEPVSDASAVNSKISAFLEKLREDPAYAHRLHEVKVNASPRVDGKEQSQNVIFELIKHLLVRLNNRPRKIVITSKFITVDNIHLMIKDAFENEVDQPVIRSLFRLYCKNPCRTLKELAKSILVATQSLVDVKVELGAVLAEIRPISSNRKPIRLQSSNLKRYFDLEYRARELNMRVLTTFYIYQEGNLFRDLSIRWYDEIKQDGSRASYIHFDHCTYPLGRVQFKRAEPMDFDILLDDGVEMIPTSAAFPEVHDLIQFIENSLIGQSSL